MRRWVAVGAAVCAMASIAVVGSAFARGGSTASKAGAKVHDALPAAGVPQGKTFTVKIDVAHAKGETLAIVDVKLHGKKLPFIVDTGASRTQITDTLARALKLTKVGKPVTETGVGCKTKAQKVKLDGWSIGGHALPAAVVGSSSLPIGGGKIGGLLGSDVWTRYGAIRIDYANETLTVG